MTYTTLLVHLDAGGANAHVLEVAASLAQQFDARVIGVAASQPVQMGTIDEYDTGQIVALERVLAETALKTAEAEFRAFAPVQSFVIDWRSISTMDPIAHAIAQVARGADLIITSARPSPAASSDRHADAGDLILRAGRPVLIVPDRPATSRFTNVVVAWADTRECRRALADALPILKRAERVILVDISPDPKEARTSCNDVAAWLARHGVSADQIVARSTGNDAASLAVIVGEQDSELIVAGAYGHNRLREWAFGGVTRDLLLRDNRCALLSH